MKLRPLLLGLLVSSGFVSAQISVRSVEDLVPARIAVSPGTTFGLQTFDSPPDRWDAGVFSRMGEGDLLSYDLEDPFYLENLSLFRFQFNGDLQGDGYELYVKLQFAQGMFAEAVWRDSFDGFSVVTFENPSDWTQGFGSLSRISFGLRDDGQGAPHQNQGVLALDYFEYSYDLGPELIEGSVDFVAAPIPEPSTYGLMGATGLLGLAAWRRRRRTSN
jgi:hypothetical protein